MLSKQQHLLSQSLNSSITSGKAHCYVSPEALSDTSAAEPLARGAQPGKQPAGAVSYSATFGFYSSPTPSAQVYNPAAQLVLRSTPGAGSPACKLQCEMQIELGLGAQRDKRP